MSLHRRERDALFFGVHSIDPDFMVTLELLLLPNLG